MTVVITTPLNSVGIPARLGPGQKIYGTLPGPNPSDTIVVAQLYYFETDGFIGSAPSGGSTFRIVLGECPANPSILGEFDDLAPDGTPILVDLAIANAPYTAFGVDNTVTGHFLWDPYGAWWRGALGNGGGVLAEILAAVKYSFPSTT
jgi:hypothetical protein